MSLIYKFLGLYAVVLRHGRDLYNIHDQVMRNSLRYYYYAHEKSSLRLCDSSSATLKCHHRILE